MYREMKRRLLMGMLVGAFACSALGAEVRFVPVTADGVHSFNGDEIILEGGGQRITVDVVFSGWDTPPLDGIPQVSACQATLDASTLEGAYPANLANGTSAGIDLLQVIGDPCGVGEDYCGAAVGAYFRLKMCHEFDGVNFTPIFPPLRCDSVTPPLPDCPEGTLCLDNPDWLFAGIGSVSGVSTATTNYNWGASTTGTTCASDDGVSRYYAGTLLLDVPVGAHGTYSVGFSTASSDTFLNDCNAFRISPLTFAPVRITVLCQADGDCDDNNACTDDTCNVGDGSCSNVPNYDTAVDCCNPADGALTTIEDEFECTTDVCHPEDGSVTHEPRPEGTLCGNAAQGECDAQDTCDGDVTCVDRVQPAGTSCGDDSTTECSAPDTCDGAGACDPNDAADGTACGDPADTDCTAPDSCLAGVCDLNDAPDDTPCDDGLFCTTDEACAAGLCTGGVFACDDGVPCTDDSCDEVNDICHNDVNDANCDNGEFCDGVEVCDPVDNCVVEPGSVPDCDDGVACTDDSCDEVDDVCVNTPNDANCDNGQFCDGEDFCDSLQGCLPVAGSVPDCDDGIDCTVDSCNESLDQCDHAPDNALCPDDGLFCTGEEVCSAAVGCTSTGCPCGEPCEVTCDEAGDTCLCDGPVALGAGSRYLAVTLGPPESTAPQAIAIEQACGAGALHYAGPPSPIDINGDGQPDGSLAFLVDDPADAAFLTPAEWGNPVYVTGQAITPETPHTVYADCGGAGTPALSVPAAAATSVWGDANRDNVANFADVQRQIQAFQGHYVVDGPTLASMDLRGSEVCLTDQIINFADVQMTIKSFQGFAYTSFGCPAECPACIADITCDDRNACTLDTCYPDGSCLNADNYDNSTYCCDPETGDLTVIADAFLCTVDTCDPATGEVVHRLMDCDDGNDCTSDSCVAGTCVHESFESISCLDNLDCPTDSICGPGFCLCPGAPAAQFEWRPVGSTGPYIIDGNEIAIPAGGVQVTVELYLSDWTEDIGTYQVGILGDESYVSGEEGSLSPLMIPDSEAGAFVDTSHPDWVFSGETAISAVSTAEGFNYFWAATLLGSQGSVPYEGQPKYGGTLILEVSPDAAGTFTLRFDQESYHTFMNNAIGVRVRALRTVPGKITIGPGLGRCCFDRGPGTTRCAQGQSILECYEQEGPRDFTPGATCAGGTGYACDTCMFNEDCDDGDFCTTDICGPEYRCAHEIGYDTATWCCNPNNGNVLPIDDGDACTNDTCNPATGEVSHLRIPGCN